jgi:hypothetical protein
MRSPVVILIGAAVVALAVAIVAHGDIAWIGRYVATASVADTPTGWKWGDDRGAQASAVMWSAPAATQVGVHRAGSS